MLRSAFKMAGLDSAVPVPNECGIPRRIPQISAGKGTIFDSRLKRQKKYGYTVKQSQTINAPGTPEEFELYFNRVTDYTDKVSLVNSVYESDLETAFAAMEEAVEEVMKWELTGLDAGIRRILLSHLTFHRETVWEIIQEARSLLISDRREYVKRLVNHHKEFTKWLTRLERQFAA